MICGECKKNVVSPFETEYCDTCAEKLRILNPIKNTKNDNKPNDTITFINVNFIANCGRGYSNDSVSD